MLAVDTIVCGADYASPKEYPITADEAYGNLYCWSSTNAPSVGLDSDLN